ncbi:type II toxin-antitoxin system death-on-curing family toxin [Nocardia stercoris]|uniref:Type II toxin-antitoxin system death-on-curing family toxin n=1 Tax=Nocardia stercoris TaxID=2483361 RepID=A0A3M2L5C9_9NOCA|nr:type II toxin-antitoxin system death-on-curing family toxin [Nocardia stercoris]RMI32859.1 type II toxin-antitoxin system death-on-curing family toxin [Nocardia stercoris]
MSTRIEYLGLPELLITASVVNGGDPAVRDVGLLASAGERPRLDVFEVEPYPTVWEKAAALLHSLARNHPFVDGNKRTALQAAALMLELHGRRLAALPDEQETVMLDVAQGRVDAPELAAALASWCD